MRFIVLAATILATGAGAGTPESDALAANGLENLRQHIFRHGFPSPETCTWRNVIRRKEWSHLSRPEKLDYIRAVQCLGSQPARTPASIAEGAKTRYDDFVVTHIQLTLVTHGNGNFLSWHRYYMWAFEQALRNECDYKGYLPYYNWPLFAEDPKASPLLDGSHTSISGDGIYVPGRNSTCVPNPSRCFVQIEPGSGGGCVNSGPFKDWKINLGPIQSLDVTVPPNPWANGLGYNPRCIKRDISTQSSLETNDQFVSDLIKNSATVSAFQNTLQNPEPGRLRIHLAGHNIIGGDAGSDFYNSPSDPYFWFHHAQVDRIWSIWQNQDVANRRFTIAGTLTFQNIPPTRNATLNDTMTMGDYLGVPNITIADASSTMAGPFCYLYE